MAATARREETDRQHPLNDLLAGLRALECFTEIEVGRLTREETAVLAERLAGCPLEVPDQLYDETEGNPLSWSRRCAPGGRADISSAGG